LLESKSFDAYKKAITLVIVMLSHLEVNMEVLSTSMGTMESDDCRELSGDDGDTNGVLAII